MTKRKKGKFFYVLVIAYDSPNLGERGEVFSRHKTYESAEKAARRSGWDSFLRIARIEDLGPVE